jgi:tRNA threonylcarbamoyladenosine biosynthesis protein TsaE
MQTLTLHQNQLTAFASWLATQLQSGDLVTLDGPLGAGKTTLSKNLAGALGIPKEHITSPTFTLVNEYPEAQIALLHSDLYRLNSTQDGNSIEADNFVEELLNRQAELNALLLVEWASLSPLLMSYATVAIHIDFPESSTSLSVSELPGSNEFSLYRTLSIFALREDFPLWTEGRE